MARLDFSSSPLSAPGSPRMAPVHPTKVIIVYRLLRRIMLRHSNGDYPNSSCYLIIKEGDFGWS